MRGWGLAGKVGRLWLRGMDLMEMDLVRCEGSLWAVMTVVLEQRCLVFTKKIKIFYKVLKLIIVGYK